MHQPLDDSLRRKPRAIEKEQKRDGAGDGVTNRRLGRAARRNERGESDGADQREQVRVDAHSGEEGAADHVFRYSNRAALGVRNKECARIAIKAAEGKQLPC